MRVLLVTGPISVASRRRLDLELDIEYTAEFQAYRWVAIES